MKISITLLVCVFILVVLPACQLIPGEIPVEEPPPAAVESEGKVVIVTPAIGPNSAILEVGDTLELQLATIPMEGFEWVVDALDTTILVQKSDAAFVEDPSPDSAGGQVVFHFTAVGTGKTILNLFYVSEGSDESPSMTTKSFSLTVTVTEAMDSTVVFSPALKDNTAALSIGEELVVQIPTLPVEGYEWVITEMDTTVLVQKGSAQHSPDTTSKPDGTLVTFVFSAVGKGTTNLSFAYVTESAEEGAGFTIRTFGVVVNVE